MFYFFWIGLGIFILLKIAVYCLTFQRVSSLTLQHPKYQLKQGSEIPDYVGSVLQKPIQELEFLGFELCGYLDVDDMIVGVRRVGVILNHPVGNTYAEVLTGLLLDSANPVITTRIYNSGKLS